VLVEADTTSLGRGLGQHERGAVKAVLWGRGKAPGLYSMSDVLGL
jgi:dihydrodipicolinate reductase